MPTRSSKPRDLSRLAAAIAAEATGEKPPEETPEESPSDKNPNAGALGRLGGKKGAIFSHPPAQKSSRNSGGHPLEPPPEGASPLWTPPHGSDGPIGC